MTVRALSLGSVESRVYADVRMSNYACRWNIGGMQVDCRSLHSK